MRLETWPAPPGDRIPNHPSFPVLIYHGVDAAAGGPDAARALFAEHGWGGSWVDGGFEFHHFHSTSHEALAVVAGAATLELGGPQGEAFDVAAGDVLVLPPAPATGAPRRARGSPSSAPTRPGRRTTTCSAATRPRRSRRHASGSPRSPRRPTTRSAATASRSGRRTRIDEPVPTRQSQVT